jgi:hypothetical protein
MIKLAASGLLVGTALAVGAAQAEPLTLTEDQMDQVTAAGFGIVDFDVFVDVHKDVRKNIQVRIDKLFNSRVSAFGIAADAEAGANCFTYGSGCLAEVMTFSDGEGNFDEHGSFFWEGTAVSESHSASSGFPDFNNGPNGN